MEDCHPLLRGGRRKEKGYNHGLSTTQMHVMATICDTLFPSLPLNKENSQDEVLSSFYSTSGSQFPLPDEAAELLLLFKRCVPEAYPLVRWILWLLSFKLGTLFLCTTHCLHWKWPFVLKFSEISLEKREEILKKWSKENSWVPLRVVFVVIKLIFFYNLFTRTDVNGHNPMWKAIGYKVDTREKLKPKKRPLQEGVIETTYETNSTLIQSLSEKGLEVTEDEEKNVYKIKCDVVIVGSGSGGGVAAAILANSGHKVIVLEKGEYFVSQDYSSLEGVSLNQLYESGGILPTHDGKMMILAGSTLGGGVIAATSWRSMITKKLHIESKVTISSCGSLLTPTLMVSSGLQNPNIGKNLHLHPVQFAWGYFPEDENLSGSNYEGGIITSIHKVLAENSTPKIIIEAPSLGPGSFSALVPWNSGRDIKDRLAKYSRTANLFALVRDKGSGEVKGEGRISYRLDQMDKENLRIGLRKSLRILVAAGAVEVGTYRSDGQRIKCKGIKEEDFEEFLDTVTVVGGPRSRGELWNVFSSAHQMGSCRMGGNEEEGAVDENGECWEAKGLYVCDGSVLPSAVGVNPMITIQSTAYCIASKIAESLK
ncbi:hypothetical protein TSUD_334980 [Trifolium subterraneum]|uniref:Long-chain-alcohol oxidase n=2 Tax=Trifolium TaxID=3898 RepID=A0A2Z6P5L5_TRISU|nr:hypothetical protein TSUD_334980 [Trifolium subterraneum]